MKRGATGRSVTWIASVASGVGLVVSGRRIPSPPLVHPTAFLAWATQLDPALLCFAVIRLAALAAATWLALASSVCAFAAVRPGPWAVRLARLMTAGGLRAALLAGISPALVAGTAAPAYASGPSPAAPGADTPPTIAAWPPKPPAPPANPPATPPGRWVVEQGESFWSIAAKVVAARSGRAAGTPATASYWVRLVEANRAGLVVRGDPDLIFPGQVLELPD